MNTLTQTTSMSQTHRAGKAMALALRLAHAENALHALGSGQIDAIVNADGTTYLMRPAQEQLRQKENRLESVLESVADVIIVVNLGGVILSQNRAVSRVLGYEPEELTGSRIFRFAHEDDVLYLYSGFFNVIHGFDENATVQYRHRARDGSYRLIEATVGKLCGSTSEEAVFCLRPVRSFPPKRDEPAAPEPTSTPVPYIKDRFLAMLSHELRTPLSPILLGVQLLQEDQRFAEALPTLRMIWRNAELQSRLLEELNDFTMTSRHKVRLKMESIDVHEAIGYVLEVCQSEIAAAGIEVRLYLQASGCRVMADSARLQQVMWNLVKNAIKFSNPGGSLAIISANDTNGDFTLDFVDHGVGIEPALLPFVFDPYQQGDRSMQQMSGGLGLGLFIAKGLVEAQHGVLTASSEGRGKGATFHLCFKSAPEVDGASVTAGARDAPRVDVSAS